MNSTTHLRAALLCLGIGALCFLQAARAGDAPGCLSKVSGALSGGAWRLKSKVERLPVQSLEHVETIRTATFKRRHPIAGDPHSYPRFRVDEIVFDHAKNIPLADTEPVQVHALKSGAASVFPARAYYRDAKGMNFTPVSWDYGYALYRSFRVSNHVFVVYTDAAIFSEGLQPFTDELRAWVLRHCFSQPGE